MPCPFCGCPEKDLGVIVKSGDRAGVKFSIAGISCSTCNVVCMGDIDAGATTDGDALVSAANRWNKRVGPAAPPPFVIDQVDGPGVERVARAIGLRKAGYRGDAMRVQWLSWPHDTREHYRDLARAAITALVQP